MPMPEAAMHENHLPSGRENQIRVARQRPRMEPIPITQTMHQASDNHLWPSILPPDHRHPLTTFLGRQGIQSRETSSRRDDTFDTNPSQSNNPTPSPERQVPFCTLSSGRQDGGSNGVPGRASFPETRLAWIVPSRMSALLNPAWDRGCFGRARPGGSRLLGSRRRPVPGWGRGPGRLVGCGPG